MKMLLRFCFMALLPAVILAGCGMDFRGVGEQWADSQKAITAYSLDGVTGTINETAKTIAVTMPYGTNVTALIATYTATTTGATGVKVGTTAQTSGTTANDFTSPVEYTVIAGDCTTATYTVTVNVAAASAKAITAYSLDGVTGTINETAKTISVTMPYGTDVTALTATFTATATDVKVGAVAQISGTTANDFTSPVSYIVTAADGTTATYTVTVAVALNSAKAITAYSLDGVTGTINETAKTISVTMPYGTNVNVLIATFTTTGASVKIGSTVQTSGTTANGFTSPVAYTVTAADGTTATYTVTVTVALNSAKAITAYSLDGVTGTIDETAKTISVTMPYGTNVTALVATFTTTGASVKVGSTVQTSGTTANDFTSPVAYIVTAADGTTATYTVTVTVALNSAKAITAYSLDGVTGTINETAKTISVTMPYGTDATALVATFTTTGASAKIGLMVQTSGTTEYDFTIPVAYIVTAADGTTATYTVTVTVALNSAKAITAYSLDGVTGTIDETAKTIAVTMPYGTNVTALVATFTATATDVKVGTTAQISGTTANDFTSPVAYIVTAADGTTATYTVTVTVALNSAKAITAYSLDGVTGTIDETAKTISVTMPYGTNVTALVATFTATATDVKVGTTAQISGTTANDFTSPVSYIVTAADSTTATYTVTVTVAAASGAVSLPKTGQTTSYAAGDDGDLEKGVAWPDPRFTVGTGAEVDCVTDNLTGLVWVKSPDSTTRTWADALTYADGLTLCGYTDWRLPNVNELESLVNAEQADSAAWLNNASQGFSNVQYFYWSSTTIANNTIGAWYVYMYDGYVLSDIKTIADAFYAWPVRAGQ